MPRRRTIRLLNLGVRLDDGWLVIGSGSIGSGVGARGR